MRIMPKDINSRRSRWQELRRSRTLVITTLVLLFVVLALLVSRFAWGFDGVSQKSRVQKAQLVAQSALNFGLTAQDVAKEKSAMPIKQNAWRQEITASIRNSLDNNVTLAKKVTYGKTTYYRDDVLDTLANQYVQTLATDRHFKITKITFDRYHNANVRYEVTPINLSAAQSRVQKYVDKQIKSDNADITDLSSAELTLLEYALVAVNWQRVLDDQLPTAKTVNDQFSLDYSSQHLRPHYSLNKSELNHILNSGLTE